MFVFPRHFSTKSTQSISPFLKEIIGRLSELNHFPSAMGNANLLPDSECVKHNDEAIRGWLTKFPYLLDDFTVLCSPGL